MGRVRRGKLRRVVASALLGLTLCAGGGGCAAAHVSPLGPQAYSPLQMQIATQSAGLDEAAERRVVGGRNEPGALVGIQSGSGAAGLAVTIHGINGSPDDIRPMTELEMAGEAEVCTFAFDDNYRRLTDSSADLSRQLGAWLEQHPQEPLTIDAHSMGGRIALGALGDLMARGALIGHDVEVNLIAPPLAGYDSANGARNAPHFLGLLIPNILPGVDMGSRSDFQRRIEALTFPENVRVRVFVGGQDEIVDGSTEAFQRILDGLGAERIDFPGGDHMTVLDATARWLSQQRNSQRDG